MRRRARVDANHADMMQALRAAGWLVIDASRLGQGFPDLLALRAGRVEFIEVKDGRLPPSARTLSEDEAKLHRRFMAAGVIVRVMTSVDDVVTL